MNSKRTLKTRQTFFKEGACWTLCLVVLLWLSTRSKPAFVPISIRITPENFSISPELSSTPERISNLWISTRDKVQRKTTSSSNHRYGLQFKNVHLHCCASYLLVTSQLTQVLTMNNSFAASPLMLRVFEALENYRTGLILVT